MITQIDKKKTIAIARFFRKLLRCAIRCGILRMDEKSEICNDGFRPVSFLIEDVEEGVRDVEIYLLPQMHHLPKSKEMVG